MTDKKTFQVSFTVLAENERQVMDLVQQTFGEMADPSTNCLWTQIQERLPNGELSKSIFGSFPMIS